MTKDQRELKRIISALHAMMSNHGGYGGDLSARRIDKAINFLELAGESMEKDKETP